MLQQPKKHTKMCDNIQRQGKKNNSIPLATNFFYFQILFNVKLILFFVYFEIRIEISPHCHCAFTAFLSFNWLGYLFRKEMALIVLKNEKK